MEETQENVLKVFPRLFAALVIRVGSSIGVKPPKSLVSKQPCRLVCFHFCGVGMCPGFNGHSDLKSEMLSLQVSHFLCDVCFNVHSVSVSVTKTEAKDHKASSYKEIWVNNWIQNEN